SRLARISFRGGHAERRRERRRSPAPLLHRMLHRKISRRARGSGGSDGGRRVVLIHGSNIGSAMAKMIQVRNVPDSVHSELVHRARKRGQTLTKFIEEILEREVSQPPIEDVLDRIAS